MFNSIRYVLKENITNFYRTVSIAKYELLSEMRESNLGLFWNFAGPAIQIFTYWFAFGLGIRQSRDVSMHGVTIPFVDWMLAGLVVWFFVSPCITKGASCIYEKRNVITKMKFPISILPATVVLKELFNHICMLLIIIVFFLIRGYSFNIYWLQLIYFMFAGICFSISLAMITSVLNMFTRDVKKLIVSFMRMLLYVTPILWTMDNMIRNLPPFWSKVVDYGMKANPIYYLVEGYRDCFFYHEGIFTHYAQFAFFWILIFTLFAAGSILMYKFKHKFIDML